MSEITIPEVQIGQEVNLVLGLNANNEKVIRTLKVTKLQANPGINGIVFRDGINDHKIDGRGSAPTLWLNAIQYDPEKGTNTWHLPE